MERLLAKKGIELVSCIDEDGARVSYAFTEELLKQKIVVVITEHSGEGYYDAEAEGEEEEWETEDWEETEEAGEEEESEDETDEEESEEDWGEAEDWFEEVPGETTVEVVFTKDNVSWTYTIYTDDRPVVPAIYLYTVVKELIGIIQESDAEGLAEDLASIATGVSISKEFEDDPEFSQHIYQLATEHIEAAVSLLQEKKAQN